MTIDDIIKTLRPLTEKATPGPWEISGIEVVSSCSYLATDYAGEAYEEVVFTVVADAVYSDDNAAYIAAASPDVTRALMDEVERLRKLFDDAGQDEHNVLALIDYYQAEIIAADERARLAYPRALQAAAGVVNEMLADEGSTDGLDMDAIMRTIADRILSLTQEQIEAEGGES